MSELTEMEIRERNRIWDRERIRAYRKNALLRGFLGEEGTGPVIVSDIRETYRKILGEKGPTEECRAELWVRGKKWPKGSKVVFISDNLVDIISEEVSEISIGSSMLSVGGRSESFHGFCGNVALFGMSPPNRYRISVMYSPTGEFEPFPGWRKMQSHFGWEATPNGSCTMPMQAVVLPFEQDYSRKNGEGWSKGQTPKGEKELVEFDVDLRRGIGTEVFRIQTFGMHYPFSLDFIRVVDSGTGETVYFEDFDLRVFECVKDVDDEDETPPPESDRWKPCDSTQTPTPAETEIPENDRPCTSDHDAEYGKARIAISSGHGAKIPGAVGILDEVTEARLVTGEIVKHLKEMGVDVEEFHDDESVSVANNINAIVNWHNSRDRDMDVSVHFNAFMPTDGPMGTEVLFLSAKDEAARVSRAIAESGGFRNRGARFRDNLGFLNRTEKPAIMLEICFVDSARDAKLYRANLDAVCKAAAGTLALIKKG